MPAVPSTILVEGRCLSLTRAIRGEQAEVIIIWGPHGLRLCDDVASRAHLDAQGGSCRVFG